MSFLLGKDWNVLAFTFERADLYRINGNRTKGRDATKIAENVKRHARTIYWAIFNQKGKLLDSGPGPYSGMVPAATLERLMRNAPKNETVQGVLAQLQRGESDKAAKIFSWGDEPEENAPAAASPPESKPARGEGSGSEAGRNGQSGASRCSTGHCSTGHCSTSRCNADDQPLQAGRRLRRRRRVRVELEAD